MSDDTRHDVLDVLDKMMQVHPTWRIGQLVANMAFLALQTETATWDAENEEFVQACRQHLQRTAEYNKVQAQAKQELQELLAARQKAAV